MDITTKTVLRHFLERLVEQNDEDFDSFFKGFFTKEELVDMLRWVFGESVGDRIDIHSMDNQQLLNYLYDRNILKYFLDQWDKDTTFRVSTNSDAVNGLLAQLGLRSHYLGLASSDSWDAYDHSNHRSLLVKAGMLKVVYGIYDREVSQKEVEEVDSHPRRYYDTYAKAKMALKEMAKPKGLHILYRHIPV